MSITLITAVLGTAVSVAATAIKLASVGYTPFKQSKITSKTEVLGETLEARLEALESHFRAHTKVMFEIYNQQSTEKVELRKILEELRESKEAQVAVSGTIERLALVGDSEMEIIEDVRSRIVALSEDVQNLDLDRMAGFAKDTNTKS